MNEWLPQVLEFLEKVLPGILGALAIGYKLGSQEKNKIKAQLDQALLQISLKENEMRNAADFADKSDDDIIRTAINGTGSVKSKPEGKK